MNSLPDATSRTDPILLEAINSQDVALRLFYGSKVNLPTLPSLSSDRNNAAALLTSGFAPEVRRFLARAISTKPLSGEDNPRIYLSISFGYFDWQAASANSAASSAS